MSLPIPMDEETALQLHQRRGGEDAPSGHSSSGYLLDLEVAMEMCYNHHIMETAAQQKKKEQKEKLGQKAAPSSKPTGIKNMGHGETIKLHLWKKAAGQDWTHIMPKDDSPDIGKCYDTP